MTQAIRGRLLMRFRRIAGRGWSGRELARWRLLTGRPGCRVPGFPAGGSGPSPCVPLRFQLPPVEPCMRFSRTRLTDVVHREAFGFSRQGLLGREATTIPLRLMMPGLSDDRWATWCQPQRNPRLCRYPV